MTERCAHYVYALVDGADMLPGFGGSATCNVRYYKPSTLVLYEGAQLIKKVRECTLFSTVQKLYADEPTGAWCNLSTAPLYEQRNFS